MKHSDFLAEIEKDPEYIAAREALLLRFAFGDAVIRERYKRGWSQAELARRAGTKQANISRIEAAIANPTLDLVKKIIDVLELNFNITPRSISTSSTKVVYSAEQNMSVPLLVTNWPKPDIETHSRKNWEINR
jgi:HTH-type transcriptional regulator / antitoxin HipB